MPCAVVRCGCRPAGYAGTLATGLSRGRLRQQPLFLAVTLSATSLGLVAPVLKDAGRAHPPVGQLVVAAASVADFGAVLLLLSLLFSGSHASTGARDVLRGGFCVLVAAVAGNASRAAPCA